MTDQIMMEDNKRQARTALEEREKNFRNALVVRDANEARRKVQHQAIVNQPDYEDPITRFRRAMGQSE